MSSTAGWISFFKDAGIPAGIAATYASTFADNRIQENMLLDLNKEYLRDMGISCMGDVIAILRHAKLVHEEGVRDRVLGISVLKAAPVAAVACRVTAQSSQQVSASTLPIQQKTAIQSNSQSLKRKVASKISEVNNYTTDNDDNKKRKIYHAPKEDYNAESSRNTIFDRLGQSDKKVPVLPPNSSVSGGYLKEKEVDATIFSRLGIKSIGRTDTGKMLNLVKPELPLKPVATPLEYQGVLKSTVSTPRKMMFTVDNNVRPTMRADEMPVSAKRKLGVTADSRKSVKFATNVQYKEIDPIRPVSSNAMLRTIQSELPAFRKQQINLVPIQSPGTDLRHRVEDKKRNVFSRLGI